MNSKAKRTSCYVLILLSSGLCREGIAQQSQIENAVFWEVSGNGLSKSSYLFGTFHLLGNLYVDSLTNVIDKFNQSETVAGEMIIDTAAIMKIWPATQLKGTTLSRLLSPEDYRKVSELVKEVSGFDLQILNTTNPISVQLLIILSMQRAYYPMDPSKDISMDLYFQNTAKKNGKKIIGLESLDDQLNALYGQFTDERQAELLVEFVANKDKVYEEMVRMNKLYRQQDLAELEKLMMSSNSYNDTESEVLLDNRNKNWMKQLPDLFKNNNTFVAVGAMHLAGKNGLVNLLRQQGFKVTPLSLK